MKKKKYLFVLLILFMFMPKVVLADTVSVSTYEELQNAILKSSTDVINVTNDITLLADLRIAKSITIDLNGNTITGETTNKKYAIVTGGKANVVLKNGTIRANTYGGISTSAGTVTLENLKVIGHDYLISISKNGNVTIDKDSELIVEERDGTINLAVYIKGSSNGETTYNPTLHVYGKILAGAAAIQGNGSDKNTSHIYVYDTADISATLLPFYLPQPCDVNILGGNMTGGSVIGIKSGTVNIEGGTLIATNNLGDNVASGSSIINTNGAVIHVDSHKGYQGNININISKNAVLESKYKSILKEVGNESDQTNVVNINITGGTFKSNSNYAPFDLREISKDKIKISGGSYNLAVDPNYVENGYMVSENNNTYTVRMPIQEVIMPENNDEQSMIEIKNDDNVQNILISSLQNTNIDTENRDILINVKVEDTISPISEVESAIKNEVKKNKLNIVNFFDIKIEVIDKESFDILGTIDNLNEKIKIEIAIPKDVQKENRIYYIIREHEEKIDVLETEVSSDLSKVIFETDKFSTYTLAYKDVEVDVDVPSTDDNVLSFVVSCIVSLTLIMLCVSLLKIKNA